MQMNDGIGKRDLFLLRHAKSDWPEGVDDRDRPLSDRGRRAAPMMAAHMAQSGYRPDLVLVSPARRTRETWELVRPALAGDFTAREIDGLYAADAETISAAIGAMGSGYGSILVIGHNPGLEDLAKSLSEDDASEAAERMRWKYPTAALAHFSVALQDWATLGPENSELLSFVTPKSLLGRR